MTNLRYRFDRPITCLAALGLAILWGSASLSAQDVANDPNAAALLEPPLEIVDSAAVQAIRASNPTSPDELMEAIDLLIRLDRLDLAREYLQRLAAAPMDVEAKAKLHERFGTSSMLRLLRPDLAPMGGQFATSIFEAAKTVAQDPQRIADRVARLGSDDRQQQLRAAAQLLRSEAFAVSPLINAISETDDPQLKANAETVLTQLGQESVAPLIAYLSGSNPRLRVAAIEALGRSRSRAALPYLVGPYLATVPGTGEQQAAAGAFQNILGSAPQAVEARALLDQMAERAYDGLISQKPDFDDLVMTWTWDEKRQTAAPSRLSASDIAALAASRLYRELSQLDPDREQYRVRSLISRLEVDQSMDLDGPLRQGPGTVYEAAIKAGPAVVQEVLRESLQDRHWPAAIGAAEVLSAIGDPAVLKAQAGQVAPLVLALTDPNRRVRFAAAQAIMKLQPAGAFPGASRLPQAIGYFAGSEGDRKMLIVHPSAQYGRNLAGLANEAGFSAEVVTDVSQVVPRAISSPDWELMMVSDAIRGTSLWSLLASLQADPKSAELPVVLLGFRSDSMPALERIADANPRTVAFPEPIESESFGQIAARGLQLAGPESVDVDRRIDQAAMAFSWLAQMSNKDLNRYSTLLRQQDHVLQALFTPQLADAAASLAAQFPTAEAQLALADVASQNTLPLAQRQAAAKAFEQSIQSFGLLLTRSEVQQQYDRYNESKTLDQASQTVLGTLLDSIEAARPKDDER